MQAYYTLTVSLECSRCLVSSPIYPSKRTQNPGYIVGLYGGTGAGYLSSTMHAPVSFKTEAKGLNETYDASVVLVSHIIVLVSYTELQVIL